MSPHRASRVGKYVIIDRPRPEPYDHCLRYWVWSSTEPGKRYLVQLDSYNGNGECQCGNFAFNLAKYLKRGITADYALAQGWVELKEDQRPADLFRCHHIIEAFLTLGEDAAKAISDAEKKNTPPPHG